MISQKSLKKIKKSERKTVCCLACETSDSRLLRVSSTTRGTTQCFHTTQLPVPAFPNAGYFPTVESTIPHFAGTRFSERIRLFATEGSILVTAISCLYPTKKSVSLHIPCENTALEDCFPWKHEAAAPQPRPYGCSCE